MTTKKTTLISNFESGTTGNHVMSDRCNQGGRLKTINGTVELAAADFNATGEILLVAPLRTNVTVTSIKLASDELDSSTTTTNLLTWDVGLYNTDGTVKDVDAYASAITMGQAATAFTEVAFEARNIAGSGRKVWQDADTTATSDPGGFYYLAATVKAAPVVSATGTVSWQVTYSEG
jgi:hypothetical protein